MIRAEVRPFTNVDKVDNTEIISIVLCDLKLEFGGFL
jgi:hypothetical protein